MTGKPEVTDYDKPVASASWTQLGPNLAGAKDLGFVNLILYITLPSAATTEEAQLIADVLRQVPRTLISFDFVRDHDFD
jgi:hypothetical protein